jgi:hypothetical protein
MQLHDGRPDVGAEHLQWEAPPQFCRHTAASQYAPVQPKPVVASNWHEHTGGGLTTEQVPCAAQRASARQYSVQVEPTKTKSGAHAVFVLGVHEGPTTVRSQVVVPPSILTASTVPTCSVVCATENVRSPYTSGHAESPQPPKQREHILATN